jgi:uncharacterized RDD family membrane protein YckC
MTQPPQEPQPEDQPWQKPLGGPPQHDPYQQPQQQQSPQTPQQPPPYGGQYGQPYGGPPSYGGQTGYGYTHPAEGLAGRGARFGAGILDLIILGVVGQLISLPFGPIVTTTTNSDGSIRSISFSGGGVVAYLIELVIYLGYFTLLHSKWEGQTVGKKALGIRLVREADRGPVSVGQALGRAAVMYFAWFLCVIGGLINLGWILWDPRRQALHCKVAKTLVINAGPQDPNPYRTGLS